MQEVAWQISFGAVLIVFFAFLFALVRSGASVAAGPPKAGERIRAGLFWVLVIGGVPLTFYTLIDLPYAAPANWPGTTRVIEVEGKQFVWELSEDGKEVDRAKVGDAVVFRVTGKEVNHGFGLYDSKLRLVTQTQAMPGYTNVLHHVFKEPGTYKIVCLEYCGLAHHGMIYEFQVDAE